jgi:serine/threonine protein kinase
MFDMSPQTVAIKIINKRDFSRDDIILQLNEIEYLRIMQYIAPHPNIINLVDYFEDEIMMYIVMEYVEGIDLYEYSKSA